MESRAKTCTAVVAVALASLVLAGAMGALGCTTKRCDVHEVDSSARGELTYSEPAAARDARASRLRAGGDATARLDADRGRGAARVVDEKRSFDDHVDAYESDGVPTVVLTSEVSGSFEVQGIAVRFAVSRVTVRFDRPSAAGSRSLDGLHAKVCEYVEYGSAPSDVDPAVGVDGGVDAGADSSTSRAQWGEVCGDAVGTVDVRPSNGDAFEADLVLSEPKSETAAPSIHGTAHIHYESLVRIETCPDIGPDIGPIPGLAP